MARGCGRVQREESCVIPAYADQCVRPWLGGEGAEEGEPMSMHHSPAREVDEAVEEKKKKRPNQLDLLSLYIYNSLPFPFHESRGEKKCYQ